MIRRSLLTDLAAIKAFDIFSGNRLLEIADDHMLVAEFGGRVVGYVSWLPRGFIGRDYITHLGVEPGHQRRGFGRALLRTAEAVIAADRLFISSDEGNVTMISLLLAEGWSPAGSVACAQKDDRTELFFYRNSAANILPATPS